MRNFCISCPTRSLVAAVSLAWRRMLHDRPQPRPRLGSWHDTNCQAEAMHGNGAAVRRLPQIRIRREAMVRVRVKGTG